MYSGYGGTTSVGHQGQDGYYWSSVQSGAEHAVALSFAKTGFPIVDIYTAPSKTIFSAVRCVTDSETPPAKLYIQNITTANCPLADTVVNDARDDRTYLIRKIGTQCWMLTNLAYAGGGTNTYGDTKTITNSNTSSYTAPYYMIPTGSNVTTGTTNPSASTSGTGQYGYLYNWCAAMGAQTSTSACANATTPTPDTSISICPSGWRLPTSNGGDFTTLNTNANSDSTSSDTNLKTNWYAMYSGAWSSGFYGQGSYGGYWSSTQGNATNSYILYFSSSVNPSLNYYKPYGFAVRCVAV